MFWSASSHLHFRVQPSYQDWPTAYSTPLYTHLAETNNHSNVAGYFWNSHCVLHTRVLNTWLKTENHSNVAGGTNFIPLIIYLCVIHLCCFKTVFTLKISTCFVLPDQIKHYFQPFTCFDSAYISGTQIYVHVSLEKKAVLRENNETPTATMAKVQCAHPCQ